MSLSARVTAIYIALALFVLGAGLLTDLPGQTSAEDSVLERFAVATDGDLLLLPVNLKGKEYLFCLDTGSTNSVYDWSLRPLLGEPLRSVEVETTDQPITVLLSEAPDARLGKLSLRSDSPVFCVDLRGVREASGHEVFGIIGMDFLGGQVLRLDPDRGEVVFLRSRGTDPGQRVPVSVLDGYPHIEASIPGLDAPEQFLVDTGSVGFGSGNLARGAFTALAKSGTIKTAGDGRYQSMSGASVCRRVRAESLTVAGNRHKNLLFDESSRNRLSLNYWMRYVVTFDFAHQALYLKKSRRFDQPDVQNMSGLALRRINGRTLVESVEKGSPADAGGVRSQDIILKVADENAQELRLQALRLLLCTEGKKLDLTLLRKDKELRATLVLRDWRALKPAAK